MDPSVNFDDSEKETWNNYIEQFLYPPQYKYQTLPHKEVLKKLMDKRIEMEFEKIKLVKVPLFRTGP